MVELPLGVFFVVYVNVLPLTAVIATVPLYCVGLTPAINTLCPTTKPGAEESVAVAVFPLWVTPVMV